MRLRLPVFFTLSGELSDGDAGSCSASMTRYHRGKYGFDDHEHLNKNKVLNSAQCSAMVTHGYQRVPSRTK